MWSSEHDVLVEVTGGQGAVNNQLAHHEVQLDVVDPDSHEGLEATAGFRVIFHVDLVLNMML